MAENRCQRAGPILILNLHSVHNSHRFWQTFYDRAAFLYDAVLRAGAWLRLGSEDRVRSEVIGMLEFPAGSRVIEIGCGTLLNRNYLPGDIQYIGLDISRGMLSKAQVRCKELRFEADLVQADAVMLPFASKAADATFAMGVLQHVEVPRIAIEQMERVTKTDGAIIVIDERRAKERILAKDIKARLRNIGEYFVMEYINIKI